jgi:hypothetical protein
MNIHFAPKAVDHGWREAKASPSKMLNIGTHL